MKRMSGITKQMGVFNPLLYIANKKIRVTIDTGRCKEKNISLNRLKF